MQEVLLSRPRGDIRKPGNGLPELLEGAAEGVAPFYILPSLQYLIRRSRSKKQEQEEHLLPTSFLTYIRTKGLHPGHPLVQGVVQGQEDYGRVGGCHHLEQEEQVHDEQEQKTFQSTRGTGIKFFLVSSSLASHTY